MQWVLGERRGGFFVEFGATDGRTINNTCALEVTWGWRGIVAEPARCWHAALKEHRPACAIDTRCVWVRSGESMDFREVVDRPEFSTIGA